MSLRSIALMNCALLAGCSFDSEGTGALASVESDTGSLFEEEDVFVAEAGPDVAVLDSAAPDVVLPDTAPVDTGTPDTGSPEAPATGSVKITSRGLGVGPTSVNLTAEGTSDWVHWGHTMTGSFNHKSGVSLIAKGMESGASTFESGALRFSWTDGAAPNPAVTDTARGLTMSTLGENVTFDVQGDPSKVLTLDVWASGTSDATIAGEVTESPASATESFAAGVYVVTFKFQTVTSTSKLHVEVKKSAGLGSFNLFAAALK